MLSSFEQIFLDSIFHIKVGNLHFYPHANKYEMQLSSILNHSCSPVVISNAFFTFCCFRILRGRNHHYQASPELHTV